MESTNEDVRNTVAQKYIIRADNFFLRPFVMRRELLIRNDDNLADCTSNIEGVLFQSIP